MLERKVDAPQGIDAVGIPKAQPSHFNDGFRHRRAQGPKSPLEAEAVDGVLVVDHVDPAVRKRESAEVSPGVERRAGPELGARRCVQRLELRLPLALDALLVL